MAVDGQRVLRRQETTRTPGAGVLRRACACDRRAAAGTCNSCGEKNAGTLRRSAAGPTPANEAPPIVHEVLRSSGRALDAPTRAVMEPRFGADFSRVRVHTDTRAAASARAVHALAYTVGPHIAFDEGQYSPATDTGRRLLAHELTHVVQQAANPAPLGTSLRVGDSTDPAEHEADRIVAGLQQHGSGSADRPALDNPDVQVQLRRSPIVQRQGDPAQIPAALTCPPATTSPPAAVKSYAFAIDEATLTPAQMSDIAGFMAAWHAAGGLEDLRVDGYASTDGAQARNWDLSCRRAQAVQTALTTSTSVGAGIPSGRISILAQGASTSLGTSLADNRKVTISITTSRRPVSPQPSGPSQPPGPVCGPDVSGQIRAAVARTRTTFAGWSGADKESACDALTSPLTGGYAWDIGELHSNAWILGYRPACASAGASPPCGSTVQVDGECSYAGSSNYVIFGVMCLLCRDHFVAVGSRKAADFTESEMLALINLYKGTGPLGLGTPSANFGSSKLWASAGYHGWPAVASPTGDRPGCSPSCPTPYGGGAFQVHWVPQGWF